MRKIIKIEKINNKFIDLKLKNIKVNTINNVNAENDISK